mmetsp:Transcript_5463/g.11538  ORF Transcript_5463/g.11538 Transcript_5463/m.11538 type:complete len:103 (+) Transcript_5463:1105-1413(+)
MSPKMGTETLEDDNKPSAPAPSSDTPTPDKQRNTAQNRPLLRSAALGPRSPSSLPYPSNMRKDSGLTHDMANGKAHELSPKPTVFDVNKDRIDDLENSYPKK